MGLANNLLMVDHCEASHPHLSAGAESDVIQTKESDNPLPSEGEEVTPSPLTGEGWDEGVPSLKDGLAIHTMNL